MYRGDRARVLLRTAVAGLVLAAAAGATAQAATDVDPAVTDWIAAHPGEPAPVIVALDRAPGSGRIDSQGSRVVGLARVKSRRHGGPDRVLRTLPYAGTTVDSAGLVALKSSSDVAGVYLARLRSPSLAQSTALINARAAWSAQLTGAGQTIAILDSGIDNNHPWFSGRIADQACFSRDIKAADGSYAARASCPGPGGTLVPGPVLGAGAAQSPTSATISGDSFGLDAFRVVYGHGTHVAGIAAGKATGGGVAPDAKLLAVNASSMSFTLNLFGQGPLVVPVPAFDDRDLLAGLDWINNQRTRFSIAAVNVSLGTPPSGSGSCGTSGNAAVNGAIGRLAANGISVVAAAGNDGVKSALAWPACLPQVLSVGATDDVSGAVAPFSDSSSALDVLAPGVNIVSARLGGGTVSMNGTSMAAPHVAGLIALYKQRYPTATPAQVETAIKANGIPTGDSNGLVRSRVRVDGALGLASTADQAAPSRVTADDGLLKADFNGDGRSDVAALYDYGGGQSGLWQFLSGADGGFSGSLPWLSAGGGFPSSQVKLTTGDFDGDGKGDVLMLYDYGGAKSGIWISYGSPSGLTGPVLKWASLPGGWDAKRAKMAPGDFDGDGKSDVAMLYDYGGDRSGLWIWYGAARAQGLESVTQRWLSVVGGFAWSRSKPVSGDFNGDGRADVGMFYNYGGGTSGLWVWNGAPRSRGLEAPVRPWLSGSGGFDWANVKPVAGDFNGDRRSDVGMFYNYGAANTGLWVLSGSPAGLPSSAANRWVSGSGNFEWGSSRFIPGDFNGDGRDDIAAFYNYFGSSHSALFVWSGTVNGVGPFTRSWSSPIGGFDFNKAIAG